MKSAKTKQGNIEQGPGKQLHAIHGRNRGLWQLGQYGKQSKGSKLGSWDVLSLIWNRIPDLKKIFRLLEWNQRDLM